MIETNPLKKYKNKYYKYKNKYLNNIKQKGGLGLYKMTNFISSDQIDFIQFESDYKYKTRILKKFNETGFDILIKDNKEKSIVKELKQSGYFYNKQILNNPQNKVNSGEIHSTFCNCPNIIHDSGIQYMQIPNDFILYKGGFTPNESAPILWVSSFITAHQYYSDLLETNSDSKLNCFKLKKDLILYNILDQHNNYIIIGLINELNLNDVQNIIKILNNNEKIRNFINQSSFSNINEKNYKSFIDFFF